MSKPRKAVCYKLGTAIIRAIRKIEAEHVISASELAISVASVMNVQMDEYSLKGKKRELFIEFFNVILNKFPHEKED